MRRAAPLGLVLALLAALAAPNGVPPLRPGVAHAAECQWKRQTKRVVKRVRRHGKLRKVVRRRHRWVCVPVSAVSLPAPVPPAPDPLPLPEPEPEEEATANRLSVKSVEYAFTLSRPSVQAGAVTVELNNQGQDAHDLNLRREGDDEGVPLALPETQSLQHSVAHFELEPGTYRLWCSLPTHDEEGMHTTLVVE
jgi:plastocyanin